MGACRYSARIYFAAVKCFDLLPAAGIVAEKIFAVHGGLSPHMDSLQVRRCYLLHQIALQKRAWITTLLVAVLRKSASPKWCCCAFRALRPAYSLYSLHVLGFSRASGCFNLSRIVRSVISGAPAKHEWTPAKFPLFRKWLCKGTKQVVSDVTNSAIDGCVKEQRFSGVQEVVDIQRPAKLQPGTLLTDAIWGDPTTEALDEGVPARGLCIPCTSPWQI